MHDYILWMKHVDIRPHRLMCLYAHNKFIITLHFKIQMCSYEFCYNEKLVVLYTNLKYERAVVPLKQYIRYVLLNKLKNVSYIIS